MTVAEGGGIFVSYRRQETGHLAARLYDRLADRFGEGQVFIDVDAIELGVDFAEEIFRAVAACKVLLAIIGPTWLTATDERGRRRLDDPGDIVRLEIEAALARGVRVIPILAEGAVMPGGQDLPESLAGLARRNALFIRYESFRYDAERLVTAIERVVAPTPGHQASPSTASPWPLYEPSNSEPSMSGRFIILMDCSAPMAGDRIMMLNFAVRELLQPLWDSAAEHPQCKMLFQALAISTLPWWHVHATPVHDVRWLDVSAGGKLALGQALSMLADELSSPTMPTWCLPPTVVLILASMPTDNWLSGLQRLNDTRWGPHITRLAIAIGKDAPKVIIDHFLGNSELGLLQANNSPSIVNYIRWTPIRITDDGDDVW